MSVKLCRLCKHPVSEHLDDGDDIFNCMLCVCDCSKEDLEEEEEEN